jgi:Icc-related predicted phosphoesterase
MRIRVLADLHLEFQPVALPRVKADVVVLAGDTHLGNRGFLWARETFPDTPVVYVMGNHEFYNYSIPKLTKDLREEAAGSGVHILENQTLEIEGVTFLGCSLWTNWELYGKPTEHAREAGKRINDFRLIELDEGEGVAPFMPYDAYYIHRDSVSWLEEELKKTRPGPVVVVTHHAPSPRSIAPRYAGHPLNPAFVSNLESLVESSSADLWIHGHVHQCFDYTLASTRILCNPRGYPHEAGYGFDPRLVAEV